MVEPPQKKSKLDPTPQRTLYVHNLSDHVGSERLRSQLYMLFTTYGEVIKVTVNVKRRRGQAFVTMRTLDESNLAQLSLNNESFFGKPLKVEFSKQETLRL
ncbi:BN860_03026g1_1 [Zygosaccharomyces bailii CLIB 213]|uniref:BN860_03026g1_1 n=1 Tax=Zygosaccharomyces bailii (strain CLIB 213 / ATCC 58445 / CBS 680 / BCRC 21525 / NBRC 1098 / NCYC 1416 / NRRL Y-2227) TaxID=1333698 RepID=A0A8J2X601_ZYGB2|nr:BN860_03026g1_1 [Zygosaccharomyces bailii CLIB 213]